MFEERDALKELELKSARDPEFLLIKVDHANGIRVPHQRSHPKSMNTIVRPRVSVFGLLDHRSDLRLLMPYLQIFPHDANLTISLIFAHLLNVARSGSLPAELHTQGDNCAKENKNMTLFAFYAVLVGRRIFERIYSESLPAGHTHTDIDLLFSPIPDALDSMDVGSYQDFINTFLPFTYRSHRNKPHIAPLPPIYSWSDWLDGFVRPLEGFSKFRSFRFELEDGEPVVGVRKNSLDPKWIGFDNEHGFQILLAAPRGGPRELDPSPVPSEHVAQMSRLERYMSPGAKADWDSVLADVRTVHATNPMYDQAEDILAPLSAV